MPTPKHPRSGDSELLRMVEDALADAARRGGSWLACRPGCCQCCVGVFAISQLDARRLRAGLRELEQRDPARAQRVLRRARAAVRRLRKGFPGDPATGIVDEDSAEFEAFANDEPCPALDPKTGTCDLYAARPMTCRVFGPPVRAEGGIGVCELCFQGASAKQIAAGELHLDTEELEQRLVRQAERAAGRRGNTLVALALAAE